MVKNNIIILKLSIKDSDPLIFRTIQVPLNYSLYELHQIIQCSFQWSDSCQYIFRINEDIMIPDYVVGTTLNDVFNSNNNKITYEYDPVDNWVINIDVLGFKNEIHLEDYPNCIDGSNASPLEGTGGVVAFQILCNILKNPDDPGYIQALEVLGEDFFPEHFNEDEINFYLQDEGELNSDYYDDLEDFETFGISEDE